MRINQNIMAFNAYRNLSATNSQMSKSLEKLSSGFRINRAADDAAGLVVSQNLRAQVSGLKVATRNAQDGVSVVQTAEGSLNEVHSLLNRMRDLAVQASNTGAADTDARSAAAKEVTADIAEIQRIFDNTKFGQTQLFNNYNGLFQVGANDGENITVNIGTVSTTGTGDVALSLTGAGKATQTFSAAAKGFDFSSDNLTFDIAVDGGSAATVTVSTDTTDVDGLVAELNNQMTAGSIAATWSKDASGRLTVTSNTSGASSAIAITAVTDGNGATDASGITTATASGAAANDIATMVTNGNSLAITHLDDAIKSISTLRATLGAAQNRFESAINNLQVATENLSASESRIRDTDMAQEMTNFTRNQILMQAGTAMLGQANQLPQSVLKLLG
jgi:flagellin